jgi:hypothetical protein
MMNDHRGEFKKILSNQDGKKKSKTAGGAWEEVIHHRDRHAWICESRIDDRRLKELSG